MAGPNLDVVVSAIDFASVLEALLYVLAALLYVYVAQSGVAIIKRALAGDENR